MSQREVKRFETPVIREAMVAAWCEKYGIVLCGEGIGGSIWCLWALGKMGIAGFKVARWAAAEVA